MKIKTIDKWKVCQLKDRKTLPSTSGLYAVLDSKDQLYYIGKSVGLRKRWSSHHRYPQATQLKGAKLAWIELEANKINKAEDAFIKAYSPPWNNSPVPDLTQRPKHQDYNLWQFINKGSYTRAEYISASLMALLAGTVIGLGLWVYGNTEQDINTNTNYSYSNEITQEI